MSRTHRTGPKFLVASVKWGEYSRWSSFIYCSMQNSDVITIGKAHPTLDSRVWIFVRSFVIKAANVKFFILLWPHVQLCWHIHRVIFTFQSHNGQVQDFLNGMRLFDGYLAHIPHGAIESQRPSLPRLQFTATICESKNYPMIRNVCMGIFECLRIQKRLKISTSACIHSTGRVCIVQ